MSAEFSTSANGESNRRSADEAVPAAPGVLVSVRGGAVAGMQTAFLTAAVIAVAAVVLSIMMGRSRAGGLLARKSRAVRGVGH